MKITTGLHVKRNSSFSQTMALPIEFMDDFSKDSTIHGIKYFSERKRHWSEKLFWIIIFVISITFCVITALDVYSRRQIRPVMISFAKGLSSSAEIPFSAVTICPESKVSKHELDLSSVLSRDKKSLSDDEIRKIRNLAQVCDFSDNKNFSWVFNDSSSQADIIPFLDIVGNPMNDMFDRCHYGSRKISDCSKLFSKVVTDEGTCFSFNMLDHKDLFFDGIDEVLKLPFHGKPSDWFLEKEYKSDKLSVFPRRVFGSGLQSGLSFELKMKRSNFNPGCKRGIQGFRLALHSPVEIPRMTKLFYSIPFEKQTTISVEPHMMYSSKDIKDYDPAARQCYFQGERILKFFKTYTKQNCELECLAKLTLSSCGCVLFSMPRDNSTEICNLPKLKCAQEAEITYVTQNLEYKLLHKHLQKDLKHGLIKQDDEGFKMLKKIESCNCLPSCTSLRYNAEISQTDFIIDDKEDVATASINIYFKSAHFTRLKRYEIYGFSDFLSSIGGIFGLFLGCSVLSFIEIIYHLFAYCIKKVKSSASQMKIASENPTPA